MYVLLAVFSAFCMALHLILLSREMRRNAAYTPLVAMGTTHLISAVLLLLPICLRHGSTPERIDNDFFIYLAMAVLVTMLSKALYLYAYAHIDVAFVTVFSALTPVLTIFSGWYFLHEMPSPAALAGTLTICAAIYYLFLEHSPPQASASTRWLWPFILTVRSRPVLCAFLSVLPPALSVVFQKKSALLFDPLHYVFYATLLEGVLAFAAVAAMRGPRVLASQLRGLSLTQMSVLGITLSVAQLTSTMALMSGLTANVMGIQRIGIVFQITLAYFLLKQRDHMRRKYITAAAILFGFLLIALSHG